MVLQTMVLQTMVLQTIICLPFVDAFFCVLYFITVITCSYYFVSLVSDHINDPKGGYMSGGGGWSGFKIFLIIVLIIVGIIVCGAVGYVIFNRDDANKRKRFY